MALFLERVGLDSGRLDGNARVTKTYNTRPGSFFKGSRGCGEPRLAKRPRPRGDPGDLEAVATITSTNSLASHPSASLLLPDLRLYNIDILGSVHNGLLLSSFSSSFVSSVQSPFLRLPLRVSSPPCRYHTDIHKEITTITILIPSRMIKLHG